MRWSDGRIENRRLRIATRHEHGAEGNRGQRVAPDRLEHEVHLDPRRLGLIVRHEMRARAGDDDRPGEAGIGRQAPQGALEGRFASKDRHMLLGEILPRQGPKARAGPATKHHRDNGHGEVAPIGSDCGAI